MRRLLADRDHQSRYAERWPQPWCGLDVEPKDYREDPIEPPIVDLSFARKRDPQDAHEATAGEDREKQQVVKVEVFLQGEFGFEQLWQQVMQPVSALVMAHFVL